MKHKIIKTENYLLVVDDSEIKTWYYDEYVKKVHHSGGAEYSRNDITKNIVAHLPLNGYGILEGVPLLPPLEVDDDAETHIEFMKSAGVHDDDIKNWVKGYNKAREKYKFIEEDVIKIVEKSRETGLTAEYLMLSLSQPKMPTHFEVDMREYGFFDCDSIVVEGEEPKTTTNSQGQTQIVGKYIYE